MRDVLYLTAEELNLSFVTTSALYNEKEINIHMVKSFEDSFNMLEFKKVDIIVSSYYLDPPDTGEAFWSLFNLWRHKYNSLPFVIFTASVEEIPMAVRSQTNFYIIDKIINYQSLVPTILEVTSNKGGPGRLCTPI